MAAKTANITPGLGQKNDDRKMESKPVVSYYISVPILLSLLLLCERRSCFPRLSCQRVILSLDHSSLSRSDAFDEGLDGFDHIIEHWRRQAGISADEEDLAHDSVGPGQIANATEGVRPIFLELNHDRLANEIPAEEHPVADFLLV